MTRAHPRRSFFGRITQYRPTDAVDPAENRLTESFAALLDNCPDLATHFVRVWTDIHLRDPRIATQVPTRGGRYVDLEVKGTADDGSSEAIVWLEVKLSAPLSATQVTNYRQDMYDQYGAERWLLWLTDFAAINESSVKSVDRHIAWQEVHKEVNAWAASGVVDRDRWLSGQFAHFLEDLGLEYPGALSEEHVTSLTNFGRAESALAALARATDKQMSGNWVQTKAGPRPNGRFFRHYRSVALTEEEWNSRWRGAWFEWGLFSDRRLRDPAGRLVFGAGFTTKRRSAPAGDEAVRWRARLEATGFQLSVGDHWRLYRWVPLESVLLDSTADEQARSIAEWVMETFDLLMAAPLPD